MYTQAPPTAEEHELAREASIKLAQHPKNIQGLTFKVQPETSNEVITLPVGTLRLLQEILGAMASGKVITIIPKNHELTTVEAADILNVSRPYVIKSLEEGKIPYRTVGLHRRILMEDLISYKRETDEKRQAILDQRVAEAQAENMGYD